MKYSVVYGTPFSSYTGTVTYQNLHCIGCKTKEEVEGVVNDLFADGITLVVVIDLITGQIATDV